MANKNGRALVNRAERKRLNGDDGPAGGQRGTHHCNGSKKNPAVMPCINGSVELLILAGRAESLAFDFQ